MTFHSEPEESTHGLKPVCSLEYSRPVRMNRSMNVGRISQSHMIGPITLLSRRRRFIPELRWHDSGAAERGRGDTMTTPSQENETRARAWRGKWSKRDLVQTLRSQTQTQKIAFTFNLQLLTFDLIFKHQLDFNPKVRNCLF